MFSLQMKIYSISLKEIRGGGPKLNLALTKKALINNASSVNIDFISLFMSFENIDIF